MRLVEIDQPAEVQFERRLVMLEMDGFQCFVEFHVRHDEPGLEARHVGGRFAEWLNAVVFTRCVQLIPHFQRQPGLNPEFVTQITGKARARHHQRVAVEGKVHDIEGFCGLDTVQSHLLENRTGGWSLQGQGGNRIRYIRDADIIEAERALSQPGDAGTATGQHEFVAGQLEDCAVVNHAAFVGAPDAVGDPIEAYLRDIPGHHAIEHGFGIAP